MITTEQLDELQEKVLASIKIGGTCAYIDNHERKNEQKYTN